jgi:hypothetical protein
MVMVAELKVGSGMANSTVDVTDTAAIATTMRFIQTPAPGEATEEGRQWDRARAAVDMHPRAEGAETTGGAVAGAAGAAAIDDHPAASNGTICEHRIIQITIARRTL